MSLARLCAICLFVAAPNAALPQPAPPAATAPASHPAGIGNQAVLADQTDRALTAVRRDPSFANVLQASIAAGLPRFDAHSNAIIRITDPLQVIQYVLDHDLRYRRGFAKLASLHLDSLAQPGAEGLSVAGPSATTLAAAARSSRIVDNAAQMRRSFMMRVLRLGNTLACTGVLVSPDIVLTAVHCLCSGDDTLTKVEFLDAQGNKRSRDIVAFISAIDETSTRPTICRAKYGDPSPFALRYPPTAPEQKGRDILLLKLNEPIQSNEADPVRLASAQAQSDQAAIGLIAGFGRTAPNAPAIASGKPPLATIVIIGDADGTYDDGHGNPVRVCADCSRDEMPAGRVRLFDGLVPFDADACKGDSGGPFFLVDGPGIETALANKSLTMDVLTSKLRIALAGITSRSLNGGCGNGAIYERLDGDWTRSFLARHGASLATDDAFTPF